MARGTIYKTSVLASAVSIFGCGFMLMGIASAFSGQVVGGIIMALCGVGLSIWASEISENKRFKVWKKKVEEGGFVPAIQSNMKTAIDCYNTLPGKKTLAYIRTLNPAAADNIEQQLAAKQQKK